MSRTFGGVVVALLLAGTAGVAGPQQPVFEGAGDTVRAFVTVTDGDGRLAAAVRPAARTRDRDEIGILHQRIEIVRRAR